MVFVAVYLIAHIFIQKILKMPKFTYKHFLSPHLDLCKISAGRHVGDKNQNIMIPYSRCVVVIVQLGMLYKLFFAHFYIMEREKLSI